GPRLGRELRCADQGHRQQRGLHDPPERHRHRRNEAMTHRLRRRAFLDGAAVAVRMPFLPSLRPLGMGRAKAADVVAPKRLLIYYAPNRMYIDSWLPKDTGPNYTLSETLMPLAAVRDDVLVVNGLANAPGRPPTKDDAHSNGSAAM